MLCRDWEESSLTEQRQRTFFILCLVLLDALMVAAALMLAFYLRLGSGLLPYTSPFHLGSYLRITLFAVPIWLAIFAMNHLYQFDNLLGGPEEYAAVFKSCTFGLVVLVFASYFERSSPLSRGWLLISWAMTILLVGGTRFVVRRIVYALRRRGWFISRAVIVGANEQAKAIARQLTPAVSSGIEVVGFADDFLPLGTEVLEGLAVLASPKALPQLSEEYHLSEIIVVSQAIAWESFQHILLADDHTLNGARVRISPGFYELLTTGVQIDHKAFVPLLTPEKTRITGVDALLKTLFNYGVVLAAAPFWLLLLAFLLLLKRATSPGPVLVRQKVLGRRGKVFEAVSISIDSEGEQDGHRLAQRLNRYLLRTGLYRLPQLFHALGGHMSLVGPRPVLAEQRARPPEWLPSILSVRPGVTGPWVMEATALDDPQEERRLDLYYVRNWTIWLDLAIVFHTIRLVLTGQRRSARALSNGRNHG